MPKLPFSDEAIAAAAQRLDCDPAAVRAVAVTESAGSPATILFEAHVFDRLTGGVYRASHPGISSKKWDRKLYGAGGAHQYDRLAEASALDRTAALKATSWGVFQIMGENHQAAGYATVDAFVDAMKSSPDAQLAAFVSFVITNHLDAPLRGGDWTAFAKGFNGPGYAANQYDTKLAAEFARAKASANGAPKAKADGAAIQAALTASGQAVATDGNVGPKTEDAIVDLMRDGRRVTPRAAVPEPGQVVSDAVRERLNVEPPPSALQVAWADDRAKGIVYGALPTLAATVSGNPWLIAGVLALVAAGVVWYFGFRKPRPAGAG